MMPMISKSLKPRNSALSRRTVFALAVLASTAWTPVASASEFPAVIPLSSLDGTNGFRLDGVMANGPFSPRMIVGAGDVNGDGFADVIIGARDADPHGSSSGSSYVVFGKASGFPSVFALSQLNGTNGVRFDGVAAGDASGLTVAGAGDVDGDGFADVIIGARDVRSFSGSSYVVFGKASGFAASLNLSSLNGTNGFRLDGVAAGDLSGWWVASAGDVNSDGFADVAVGTGYPDGSGPEASYVMFGKASGFAATINLSSLDGSNGFRLDGVAAGDESGHSIVNAGDVNGDGFADVIVGAPFADPHGSLSGSSYVVFGKASDFTASMALASLNGSNGFRLDGVAAGDLSGYSAESAGDVNGDGFADVIIGARYSNGSDLASAYVVFGHAHKRNDLLVDLASAGLWQWLNNTTWVRIHAGSPLAVATGDLDGNSQDEAIVSFNSKGLWAHYNDTRWTKLHNKVPTHFVTGDLDGNGKDEIIADLGAGGTGGLWIFWNNTTWTKLHGWTSEELAVGDLDGNRKKDLIVDFGANGLWAWFNATGWMKLYTTSPAHIVTGDLDGDGKDDLVADLGSRGLFARYNNATPWVKLHFSTSEDLATGDLDGNGQDELIADFGSNGLYARYNNTTWHWLHSRSPFKMVATDLDRNGQDDFIAAFGGGLYVRYNDAIAWVKRHAPPIQDLAAGGLD
jgi:hypothetical protein